jgi:hypothetical protein
MFGCEIASSSELMVELRWTGGKGFEATLFAERDHCPEGMKAATWGPIKAVEKYIGCWRLDVRRENIELFKTHRIDTKTLRLTQELTEGQSVPVKYFK